MELHEKLLDKKVVYPGRYLRVEERRVLLPDGRESTREVACPPNAVAVLPVDATGRVHLVRQYRTAIEAVTLEIPAGILEAGEAEEETARRECEEEIGVRPERLDSLVTYFHSVGFSTGWIRVFLGRDLVPRPHSRPAADEFLQVVALPFEDLLVMVLKGEIVDSKTIIAALWYRHLRG
jgi:ADP-ribose pyrophosphatase